VTIRVPHKESQTIHPIQQLSGSALRLALTCSVIGGRTMAT
jgi:hypothetical protein